MADKNDTLDSICGTALLMGLPRTSTAIIEFTGAAVREAKKTFAPVSSSLPGASSSLSSSKSTTFELSREAIDSRLELLKGRDYVLPVEGRYWTSIGDYLSGKEPHYKGEINGDKAGELGLYDSGKATVRVYKDNVTFPRRE